MVLLKDWKGITLVQSHMTLWRECGAGHRIAGDRIARRTTKSKSEAG